MILYRFFEDWDFHYVRTSRECSLLGLVEYGMALRNEPGPQGNLDLPALFDLRATELDKDSADDIKKAIRLRQTLKSETGGNPCAYVVASPGSFGVMRMYSIYAEIAGLRREELTLITEDLNEAINWVAGHISKDDVDADAILQRLSQVAGPEAGATITLDD